MTNHEDLIWRVRAGVGGNLGSDVENAIKELVSERDACLTVCKDALGRAMKADADLAAARAKITATDLIEWLKNRPGASWVATINDVHHAMGAIAAARAEGGE